MPEATAKYARFAAMIVTAMVVMYGVMYLNTYQLSHVFWSETRFYMTLLMGSTMAVIMLGYMLGMYERTKVNLAIFAASVVVFAASLWLVRSQVTVDDESYMRAMIPHHSIAILTSERVDFEDRRVQKLADEIIEAQLLEIDAMKWLLDDIERNGEATTEAEAAQRPVPQLQQRRQ